MRRVQFLTLGLNSLFFTWKCGDLNLFVFLGPPRLQVVSRIHTDYKHCLENTCWVDICSYVGVEPRFTWSQTSRLTIRLSPMELNSLYLISNLWSKHLVNLLLALNILSKITCIDIQIEPLFHKTKIQDHDCSNNLKF